jgi:sugar/nucleoside kinase (ribokinase family)
LTLRGPAWDQDRDFDVAVVGDLNIDLILSGLSRVPQFGEELLASGLAQRLGGSAANFAVCCARLGLNVALVANVGQDEFGDYLCEKLQQWGVATDYVSRHPELATGITVSLSGPSDRGFVTYLGTIDSLRGADVPRELLGRCRHLHLASYFLQTTLQPDCVELARAARDAGVTVSLDTGFDPEESWDTGLLSLLPEVDIFLPNEVEARAITETPTLDAALAALCGMTEVVALKMGPDGAMACAQEETIHVPSFAVEVADTTCCGDAFNAGFVEGLLAGLPLREAISRGNACGGLMASVVGNEAECLTQRSVAEMIDTGPIDSTGGSDAP